jgi:ATPase family associated with various cellular activities (AAA)
MADDELPDLGTFAATFETFMRAMSAAAEHAPSEVAERMQAHLGTDPAELPITSASFGLPDHPNLQLALDAVLPGAELLGFSAAHLPFQALGMRELVSGRGFMGPIEPGPVQYTDVEVGDGRVIQCVSGGLFLATHAGEPVAVVVSRSDDGRMGEAGVAFSGVAPGHEAIPALLRDLRAAMREHNVYRGRTISFHADGQGAVSVQFHVIAPTPRDGVVLPPGTLERLERQAIGVAAQADRLRAAGRHLKRGVLLHGPPGTGKTLTVNYLLGAMPGRTTVLLTGRALQLIEPAVAIARDLAPATLVFEDIDLVATERTLPSPYGDVLSELLNAMEGLGEDDDLLFLLTTNRPDVVEPALAARPGRVDLALEVPLPDAEARARLLRLYAQDIALDDAAVEALASRSEGVSGAFVKELMRAAALRGALEDRSPTAQDVDAVLDELLEERSALTRRLLGQPATGATDDVPAPATLPAMLRAFEASGLPLPPGFPGVE